MQQNYAKNLAKLTNQTRGIVGSILAPACRVWLRSQVSHVDDLQVDIAGGSRQILGGTIPGVTVVAVGGEDILNADGEVIKEGDNEAVGRP